METSQTTQGIVIELRELKMRLRYLGSYIDGIWDKSDTKRLRFNFTDAGGGLTYNVDSSEMVWIDGTGDLVKSAFDQMSSQVDPNRSRLGVAKLPDQILPNLYLGSHQSAENWEGLSERNITCIVTVGRGLRMPFKDALKYHHIDILDLPTSNLMKHFDPATRFIADAHREGGSVLIHCAAGISRSSTITIAYLMYLGSSFNDAQSHVGSRRFICPNEGFRLQLLKWEKTLKERRKQKKLEDALL
eukprot:TRINITY_DN17989_c0_g1_i1.p1 TRINITY_DN17989_c0_g1~~TRINITY_DN17989_c0_g1_i1.p1  ORF type:complete len:245 (+),score=49.78 TRINITY_DN17989_c0_g1_i1:3-737(+)